MRMFKHVRPITDEEEARIQAGIAADPDNPELTEEEIGRMRPAREVMPPAFFEAVKHFPKRGRGKQLKPTKELVTIRLDREVVAFYKHEGEDWRRRINAALQDAIARKKRARAR